MLYSDITIYGSKIKRKVMQAYSWKVAIFWLQNANSTSKVASSFFKVDHTLFKLYKTNG